MRALKELAIGLTFILLSACAKSPDYLCRDTRVMVWTAGAEQGTTRASSSAIRHIYSMEDGLALKEMVSDCGFEENGRTRGAVITTDGYNKINESGRRFNMEGWLGPDIATAPHSTVEDKANQHFLSDTPAYDGSVWNFNSDHFWRNGISTTFWSYYVPAGGVVPVFTWPGATPTEGQLGSINFTYTIPASSGNDDDAYNSKDFLIAYNKEVRTVNNGILEMTSGTGEASYKNSINIKFRHPLSAIKFKVGSISGDSTPEGNEYVRITKVELLNVKTSGSFTAAGVAPNGCTVTCNSTSGSATYSQAATRAEIEGGKFTDAASEFVFFMIPQDLSGVKARLTMVRKKKTVTYESDGKTIHSISYGDDITFTREVNLTGTWAPGYYYTYSISSTVYFGGEELTLPPDFVHSDNMEIDGNKISFSIRGSISQSKPWEAYVAPLSTKGVNVIRLELEHSYKCKSGKSHRHIWLEAAKLNPNYVEGSTDSLTKDKFIGTGLLTKDSGLVSAVTTILGNTSHEKYSKYHDFWPNGYRGILGDAQTGTAGADDRNMNTVGASETETQTSVMYFYLGGEFDYIMIHFEYWADSGESQWKATVPLFNITETVE